MGLVEHSLVKTTAEGVAKMEDDVEDAVGPEMDSWVMVEADEADDAGQAESKTGTTKRHGGKWSPLVHKAGSQVAQFVLQQGMDLLWQKRWAMVLLLSRSKGPMYHIFMWCLLRSLGVIL